MASAQENPQAPPPGNAETKPEQAETKPEQAEEQKKLAFKLFLAAVDDIEHNSYAEARRKLVESRQLDPTKPQTLFALADCEYFMGQLLTAKRHYQEFLAIVQELPEKQRRVYASSSNEATERLIEVAQDIPRIRFIIPPGWNLDTIVRLDGIVLSFDALQNVHPIDPGDHRVVIQSKGRPPREEHYTVNKREEQLVYLQIPDLPKPPPAPVVQPVPIKVEKASPRGFWKYVPPAALGLQLLGLGGVITGSTLLVTGTEETEAGSSTLMITGGLFLIAGTIVCAERLSIALSPKSAHIRPQLAASPQGAFVGLNGAF